MKRTPKTPALAKMAMLLLFAIGAVAVLGTNTISAQELGRTITSPFGIARQPSTSESGSDGDTFVDPETGEVGHIIRNPFGVANPEGVDTGIDIPDDAGEEVGGIITSPFGVPASDDIDTGVDVFDEDEEYLISLPDDEESDAEDSEDVDEVDDETSDDVKELEEEAAGTTTEKYVPVIDNPIRGVEFESFSFTLTGASGNISIDSEVDNISDAPMLYVATGSNLDLVLTGTTTMQSDRATISIVNATNNFPSNEFALQEISFDNNDHTIVFKHNVSSSLYNGSYNVTVSYRHSDVTVTRCLKVEIVGFRLQMPRKIIGVNNLDRDRDGVPDFADGFDCVNGGVSAAGKSAPFAELKLAVLSDIVNSDYAVEFCFDESPYTVIRNGDNTEANPYCYKPEEFGQLRIWTKDGGEARLKAPITATSPGDCVPRNTTIPLNKLFSGTAQANTPLETTLYVEAINPSTTFGGSPITVKLYKNGMERINNSIPTTAVKVSAVTPNETSDGSKAIKIMIETDINAEKLIDPVSYLTTRYYTTAQKSDHQVNITATIEPQISGVPVYFEVIDPDDLSPYEGKALENGITIKEENLVANDNQDPLKSMLDEAKQEEPLEQDELREQEESQQEEEEPPKDYTSFQTCLSARSATTDEHGKATVVLDITNQYSGDNYIVRSSCIDPGRIDQEKLRPFDKYSIDPPPVSGNTNNKKLDSLQYKDKTTIAQTALLVAWKRTYIEHANMFKMGATVTIEKNSGFSDLTVDNTEDFFGETSPGANDGTEVIIFFQISDGIVMLEQRVVSKTDNAITLNACLPVNIPQYSGVKLKNNSECFANDTSYLVNAFGGDVGGIDGGAFIEFRDIGTHYVPKYTEFSPNPELPGDPEQTAVLNMYYYANSWRMFFGLSNTMLLVAAKRHYLDNILGVTNPNLWMSFVMNEKNAKNVISLIDLDKRKLTVAHEMGHIWRTKGEHIDQEDAFIEYQNHEATDDCAMTNKPNRNNSIAEFCIDCLNHFRKYKSFTPKRRPF